MIRVKFNLKNVAITAAIFAVTAAFAACEPADEPNPDAPAIAEFAFANQRGASEIDAKKRTVKATAECGTNIASLSPEFKLSPEGATATVNGEPQVSGKTAQNFAEPVVYTLTTPDGETAEWTVTVTLPDDCPQVKKYITYNKPVTAYYIEYKDKYGDNMKAYESKQYSFLDPTIGYIIYKGADGIEYFQAGSNKWYRVVLTPDKEIWATETYRQYEYPLGEFAAYVSKRKDAAGFLHYGYPLWEIASRPDYYEMPNHTDVSEFYVRSEKVLEILCDVYKDSERTSEGTETWTWWVDPATGFTLKYERIKHDGSIENFVVTKLTVGVPDWDGLHLRPKASDTIENI